MKKSLVLVAMAGVALASCVNDVAEVAQNDQKKVKIAFDAPALYYSSESRVATFGEIEGVYPDDESFVVYGIAHEGNFTSWDSSVGLESLMDGVTVTYVGDLDGWAPATDVFWPYYKKCTFAAYSPAGIDYNVKGDTEESTIKYGAEGLVIPGYEMPNLGQQYDLMYTPREYNRTTSYHPGTIYNGVPLTFKHALSSIHFALVSSHTKKVTLKSIEVQAVSNKATFKETITDGSSYVASPEWSGHQGTANYDIYTYTGGSAIEFPTEMRRLGYLLEQASIPDQHHGLMAIPQNLDNVKLVVKYSIEGEGDTTKPIDLKSYFGNEWRIGTRYYYVLSIGSASSKIYFAPIVDTWSTDDTVIQLQ